MIARWRATASPARRPRTRQARGSRALTASAAVLTALASGCGGASAGGAAPTGQTPSAAGLSASTSLTAQGQTWAVIPMGGTGPNLFWQLFSLPAGGGQWTLKTPSAIATNGALILAPGDGTGQNAGALTAGVRPSLDLSFSPVVTTRDGGGNWVTVPPDTGLANVPDALAAAPDGRLLSLGQNEQVAGIGSATAPGWAVLTSRRALAGTAAGRECSLTGLTAVAYAPAGTALVGGDCGRAGVVGIFSGAGGRWRLTGPALPGSLSRSRVRVLRLTRDGGTDTALLETGSGSLAALVAAWSEGGAANWRLSPAFRLRGAQPVSASFGPGAVAVLLTGNRGEILRGPGSPWRSLGALPAGQDTTLAVPTAGAAEALVADGSQLSVWRLGSGPAQWSRVQRLSVPIQYGSST